MTHGNDRRARYGARGCFGKESTTRKLWDEGSQWL
jgi:hypothetical protein